MLLPRDSRNEFIKFIEMWRNLPDFANDSGATFRAFFVILEYFANTLNMLYLKISLKL